MKKVYSTILMLAIMVAALSFTACSSDDEDEIDGGGGSASSSTFTIVYTPYNDSEEIYTYNNNDEFKTLGAEFDNIDLFERTSGSHFSLMIGVHGYLNIVFPSSKYGKDLDSSYFGNGYSDFGEDATEIVLIDFYTYGWYGEYLSGNAKVIKNDGKNITISFKDYKVSVSRSTTKVIYIKLNGTLAFSII